MNKTTALGLWILSGVLGYFGYSLFAD